MTDHSSSSIDSSLHESRCFQPPSAESLGLARWHVPSLEAYRAMHAEALADPVKFWGRVAGELFWHEPWEGSKVVEWSPPDCRWFVGGKTNICYNCVDRHVHAGHGGDTAIVWEGEPIAEGAGWGGEVRTITFAELRDEVSKFANVLKALGVRQGDVVTIYMGMVPELTIAMLACARIGAVHSVIFGGFSAQAIVDRVLDASSRTIVTCDGAWRRGKVVPLKENVDAACATLESLGKPVNNVVMLRRTGCEVAHHTGRDHDWHDLMLAASDDCPCMPVDSEHMLFLLYTSGSTGKPKGIMHTTAGYMVYTYLTARLVFNLGNGTDKPNTPTPTLYWCTADCGWITGHSYIVYGILANRTPTLMYEGAPNFPAEDRFWDIVQRHRVTHFYTAPTAIRAFMKWGREHADKHDLSSLRVLGTVGEPINPEAWMWYHRVIGREKCPIVDTYWQTETAGHVITPLPGATPTVPGSCTLPFPGIDAAIVDEEGNELPANKGGLLVIRRPWPGMLRGVFGDRERFVQTYWSRVKGPDMTASRGTGVGGAPVQTTAHVPYYTAGDAARRDEHGNFWIMGRIDDVINVSGHRLGTMEVESALVSHDAVVEAAVVGMPHEIKGTGVAAFVTLEPHCKPSEELKARLREHVAHEIGAIAKPDIIRFTQVLPKTRSGKIMRRLLRDIAAGVEHTTQDTTTLEDFSVLAKLRETEES